MSPDGDLIADGGDTTRDGGGDVGTEDGGSRDGGMLADGGTDGGGGTTDCLRAEGADPTGTDRWEDALGTSTVTVEDREACLRTYTLETTADLRDGLPANPRTIEEQPGWPTLRSGHDLFDALHALALEEVRQNSVAAVRDGAFDNGNPVDCGEGGCFETGRKWNYVWTRDTAYAVHLGLAAMDPMRARNSLAFKLSERRGGGGVQIVQDTGSGGSYPVSSDRVSWALGASALLPYLEGTERTAFRDRTYAALRNTVEHDRAVVFDAQDGLYFGEQSFLDWREQTYPEFTANDVVPLAESKALGTNLLHLRALEVTAALAEEAGDDALADRYGGWAEDLRSAVRDGFWLEEAGLFSTYVISRLDPAPARRYDLLASAFAVLFGVADDAQATRILSRYPHYGPGAPVVWPQQQRVPIYHNRGEWPFVTAYWLRAARAADHDAVADRMVRALVRGAALNLSNMENFEAATGAPWVDEGETSGPVVNSQRQLWSVAGYLSMVHHTIFGLEGRADGLRVRPWLTRGLRRTVFGGTDRLILEGYPYRGARVSVVVHLPEASDGGGTYEVASMEVDGVEVEASVLESGVLPEDLLGDGVRVDVMLAESDTAGASLTEVDEAEWQNVFGPRTPRIGGIVENGGRVELTLDANGEDPGDVTWTVYRDGARVATDLPGNTTTWTDPDFDATGPRTPCYAAELTFSSSGNHSQHSPPACWWGAGAARITTIDASDMAHVGGEGSTSHGRFHYEPWGDPGDSLTLPSFTPTQSGPHLLQLTYGNGAGPINTGVTCAIKRVVVEDADTGEVVAEGPVVMPHLGTWSRWEDSSVVEAELEAGRDYRIVIRGDDEMVNMSAFAHFERYTGGLGGTEGAFNRVNVAELKILAR